MKSIIAIITGFIIIIASPVLAQEPETGGKLVKRKVLVLPFVDLGERKAKAEYLSVSIPEAIISSLKQSGSFEVLSLDDTKKIARKAKVQEKDFYSEGEAIKLGKEAQVDVVLMGNYFVVTDKTNVDAMQVQAKVLDVHTGRNRVTVTRSNDITGSVFAMITDIAREVTRGMVKELPPLTEREIKARRNLESGGRDYPFVPNLTLGIMANMGISPRVIGSDFKGIGLRALLETSTPRFVTLFLNLELEFWYAKDTLTLVDILYGSVHMGASYPLKINNKFSFSPFLFGGIFTGIIPEVNAFFLVPSIKPGVNFKYAFSEKKGINLHFAMPYILDPGGYFFTLETGISYAIKF